MSHSSLRAELGRMLTGYWASQMLYVAARLNLAGLLKDGPRSSDDLARSTGTEPRALCRLLRGLASLGVFAEGEPRRFAMTPLAELLRDDVPGSQRAMALMMGEEHYAAWGRLLDCVRTGKTGFEMVYGMRPFDYLSQHPDKGATFDAAMTSVHGAETPAMLAAYDFSNVRVLADVGGGNGRLLAATLAKYPHLAGILYDLPPVIERSQKSIAAAGLADRCRCISGSFFESVPAGADAYLLRHIIHDWNDEESLAILKNCRAAIGGNAQGRLLLVETVIPPGNDPMFGKLLDLNMLVIPGGLERTEEEYRALYKAAGFRLSRIVPTTAEVSVIEGVPV